MRIIVGFEPEFADMSREAMLERVNAILAKLSKLPVKDLQCYVPPDKKVNKVAPIGLMELNESRMDLPKLRAWLKERRLLGIAYFERDAPIGLSDFNDPRFAEQWALRKLQATEAWPNPPVIFVPVRLAIIDSGLRRHDGTLHADLGNVANVIDCQPQPDNGVQPPFPGLHLDNIDQDGHGTFLAGTIAAVPDNMVGIASGIPGNWPIELLPVKFFGVNEPATAGNAVIALKHAIVRGARVIDASWHVAPADRDRQALRDVIREAKNADCLVVTAAGNDGTNNEIYPTYPANYASELEFRHLSVLAVAASDRHDVKAGYSNYGPAIVDIAAPGDSILTTGRYLVAPVRYQNYSGTSASAAYVAAGAALVRALNPGWTSQEVVEHLLVSADTVAALGTTSNGGKRLNLGRAVRGPLRVQEPAEGSRARVGRSTRIRWTNAYDNPNLDRVRIQLSLDDGLTWPIDIAADTANDGRLSWKPRRADRTRTARICITPLNGNFPAVSRSFRVV